MRARTGGRAAFTPRAGEVVRDVRAGRDGVYMDTIAGEHYLRPEGGGCEWTALPEHVGPGAQAGSAEPGKQAG
ncbi:hypothetical protein [Kitasatospora herbaricolor]|uniref:Uncharacterized protein n=1 Tax=Kitasatospora herbaricolor TaxID=68217 RepID=A0ABZ1WBI9_9ACTN|nr:hypothetical protein [Kitasatospora herbaricolor]